MENWVEMGSVGHGSMVVSFYMLIILIIISLTKLT